MNKNLILDNYLFADKKIVDEIKQNQPSDEPLYNLADLYKIFGDTTRIKILYALSCSEMCVGDIAEVLEMSVSAISHQLRTLKQAHLVSFRRQGKTSFYSLADDHVGAIIKKGMEHINERK